MSGSVIGEVQTFKKFKGAWVLEGIRFKAVELWKQLPKGQPLVVELEDRCTTIPATEVKRVFVGHTPLRNELKLEGEFLN